MHKYRFYYSGRPHYGWGQGQYFCIDILTVLFWSTRSAHCVPKIKPVYYFIHPPIIAVGLPFVYRIAYFIERVIAQYLIDRLQIIHRQYGW